jgi:hypothetical protein
MLVEEALISAAPAIEWPKVYRDGIKDLNRKFDAEIEHLLACARLNVVTRASGLW